MNMGLRLFWPGAVFCLKTNTGRYSLFKHASLQAKIALSRAKIGFGIGLLLLGDIGKGPLSGVNHALL